ncbi:MAG: carbon-nitrogen hydrolase family protein [Eubacteriales bacterium]|nr:carbon-nitrogen hydrolase family protein [Eubacteriales bacterium]
MRIFSLELNNEIKGIGNRKRYMEALIAKLTRPDLIVLPELAMCSYMGSSEIWQYADADSLDTSSWAMETAGKYNTFIAVGYLEKQDTDFYNSYLLADKDKVYGIVRKSEGESYLFKRGDFDHIISAPFGKVAVGICYDARRKHFYNNIKDQAVSLILFPHGSPSDPEKSENEIKTNDFFCKAYMDAFGVPVIYVNSIGKMDFMLGKTGEMMMNAGFRLNGHSKIYSKTGATIETDIPEALGMDIVLKQNALQQKLRFFGNDINRGNFWFRNLILKPDIKAGCRYYHNNRQHR